MVAKVSKNEIDMTSGNLFKKILVFSLPIIFSSVLQLLYNAADLIVCGQFGSAHSVGAVSATNSLINLIIQLFMGLSVGANVLMARYFGTKQKEKAQTGGVHGNDSVGSYRHFAWCLRRIVLTLLSGMDENYR